MSTYSDTEVSPVSTDDEDDTPITSGPDDSHFPDDGEFDPYDSGLNDFTFEDNSDSSE